MAYLTDEQRKQPLTHYVDGYTFITRVDLSGGVKVRYDGVLENTKERLMKAVAEFSVWWSLMYHRQLNGFSGMDCVEWNIEETHFRRGSFGCHLQDATLAVKGELAFHHKDTIVLDRTIGEVDGVEYSMIGMDTDGSVYVADENGDFKTGLSDLGDDFLKKLIKILENED